MNNEKPSVLCIKGKWGVGKTHLWNFELEKAQKENRLSRERYAYVSLFGLENLTSLKMATYERTVQGGQIGTPPTIETISKNISKFTNSTRAKKGISYVSKMASDIFLRGNRESVASIATALTKNQLVCFDDLERASSGLELRDLLGYASYLCLEQQCKVVIILNDAELDTSSGFEKYLEKVADDVVCFEPTSREAIDIAISTEDAAYLQLAPLINSLKINNIRVIQKIAKHAAHFDDLLRHCDPEVVKQVYSIIVIGCWSFHQPELAPSMALIRNFNKHQRSTLPGEDELGEEEQNWLGSIRSYGILGIDELDHALLNSIEKGYVENSPFEKLLFERQEYLRRTAGGRTALQVWNELYYGSLADNDDVFLEALFEAVIKDIDYIGLSQLNTSLVMLREYGKSAQADEIVEKFLEVNSTKNSGFFDLKNHHLPPETKLDRYLLDLMQQAEKETFCSEDPMQLLLEVAASG